MKKATFVLVEQCIMKPFTEELKNACDSFSCGNGKIEQDLNDFFANDSFLYRDELLGKTYCWVTKELPRKIIGLFTISNDSIKTTYLERSTSNRLNRHIFMVVDAHNHPRTIKFYEQNGFKFLHKTEDEERQYYHIREDEPILTRLMYFDLKNL